VQYNTGVTAYRSNDFSSAATTFEQATASPDKAMQQRAFYNLGNTSYRLGEADPTKAQPLWGRAIKSYEAALALAEPQRGEVGFHGGGQPSRHAARALGASISSHRWR
jgi:TolA-binding protein